MKKKRNKVSKGDVLENVVYSKQNLLIQKIKEHSGRSCVILGNGNSLSINEENRVTWMDPGMHYANADCIENHTIFAFYFPNECKGLVDAASELAFFINARLQEYDEIILIGHSKCGICLAYSMKWIEREVRLITISSPFRGTILCEPDVFERGLTKLEIAIYRKIYSDHQVDRDISTISKVITRIDVSRLNRYNYINVVSVCGKLSDVRSLKDLAVYYINWRKNIEGDGFVPKRSQRPKGLYCDSYLTLYITASHAVSLKVGLKALVDSGIL